MINLLSVPLSMTFQGLYFGRFSILLRLSFFMVKMRRRWWPRRVVSGAGYTDQPPAGSRGQRANRGIYNNTKKIFCQIVDSLAKM